MREDRIVANPPPVWHLAARPFVARCGADAPGQGTTEALENVTCPACLRARLRAAEAENAQLRADNAALVEMTRRYDRAIPPETPPRTPGTSPAAPS